MRYTVVKKGLCYVKGIYDLDTVGGKLAVKLRLFLYELSEHMHVLKALDQESTKWGLLLIHLISTKLNKTTLKE